MTLPGFNAIISIMSPSATPLSPVIKFAQLFQTVWTPTPSPHPAPLVPQFRFFFSSIPSVCHLSCSPLASFLRAALIKHGVGDGAESSSWAEEKGSNSTSQDGAVTHNGPTILSVPPWIPQLKSPLLRQLFNRPSSIWRANPVHISTHKYIQPHVRLCCMHTHTHATLQYKCVSLVLQLTLLWAFQSAPEANDSLFSPLSTACWGR